MTVCAVGRVGLRSPVMTAAGTAGTGTELAAFGRLGDLGAVVVKSLAPYPWEGNPPPRLVGVPGGMLNAVGLSGPGIPRWIERDLPLLEREGATVVVSVWGRSADEYEVAAGLLAAVSARLAAVEVNLSCPNLSSGQGASHPMFAHDPAMSAGIVRGMARTGLPVWAKLSPNTDRLVEVAGVRLAQHLVDHRQMADDGAHGEPVAQVAPLAPVRFAVQLRDVRRAHDLPEGHQRVVVGPLVGVAPGGLVGLHAGDHHVALAPEPELVDGAEAPVGLQVVELLQPVALGRQAEAGVVGQVVDRRW